MFDFSLCILNWTQRWRATVTVHHHKLHPNHLFQRTPESASVRIKKNKKKQVFAFSLTCHWNLHGSFFSSFDLFPDTKKKQCRG